MAKWVSLVVKVGAVVFVIALPQQYAINLQLLGGMWIIQTLPAVIVGLYTRWLNEKALLVGGLIGIVVATWLAASQGFTPITPLSFAGYTLPCYTAVATLVLNFVIAIVLTPVFNALGTRGIDETRAHHYG